MASAARAGQILDFEGTKTVTNCSSTEYPANCLSYQFAVGYTSPFSLQLDLSLYQPFPQTVGGANFTCCGGDNRGNLQSGGFGSLDIGAFEAGIGDYYQPLGFDASLLLSSGLVNVPAFSVPFTGAYWHDLDVFYDVHYTISGTASVVPEVGTGWLFGGGILILLTGFRRHLDNKRNCA
jgi:hypothetical protein